MGGSFLRCLLRILSEPGAPLARSWEEMICCISVGSVNCGLSVLVLLLMLLLLISLMFELRLGSTLMVALGFEFSWLLIRSLVLVMLVRFVDGSGWVDLLLKNLGALEVTWRLNSSSKSVVLSSVYMELRKDANSLAAVVGFVI